MTFEEYAAMSPASRDRARRESVRAMPPGTRVRVTLEPRFVSDPSRFDGLVGVVAVPGYREPSSGITVPQPGSLAYVDFPHIGLQVLNPLALRPEQPAPARE